MTDARSRAVRYALAFAVFGIDRWTKWIIESRIGSFDNRVVIPGFFDIVFSQNSGAAFGLFAESSPEWRSVVLIGFSAVALVALTVMLWRVSRVDGVTATALSLILGGALGNVFDRVMWGKVTDFLLFYIGQYQWPAFNAADSAIVIGSGLLLLEFLKPRRQPAHSQDVS